MLLLVNNIVVSDSLKLDLSTVKVHKRDLRKYEASKMKLVILSLCQMARRYKKKHKKKIKEKQKNHIF